jgi:RNA polymerase sigma factor (sigma-70 family)
MDDLLSARFASGDPGAVRDLYRKLGRPVFSVAYRILGDRGLAEEAVQLTFLQAWQAADRFDPQRDIAPWLFTIARRVAIDVYRRERRHQAEELGDRDIATLPPSMEQAWTAWEVRRALDQLPAEERDVLRATHFDGMTHEEAARALGIPIGTVKSRSFRAYRRLAEFLAHLEEASA